MRRAAGGADRLIEYFLEVVAEPVDPEKSESQQPQQLEEGDVFERRVVIRIPQDNRAGFPLPNGIEFFCIPDSELLADPSAYDRRPSFFSFLLTCGNGTRAYGFVLHVFEEHRAAGSACWRPRVLCLISRHPFFSLFKETLSWVYRRQNPHVEPVVGTHTRIAQACDSCTWFISPRRSVTALAPKAGAVGVPDNGRASTYLPAGTTSFFFDKDDDGESIYDQLARVIDHAVRPPSGGVVELDLGEDDDGDSQQPMPKVLRYHVQRGKATHLDDHCFQLLFQCLSLENVVYIVNCMLLEQRILIHSSHAGLLTPICEALCTLLYPFTWEHVYIPFLPVKLIEYLHAPVPYMIGLHTSSLATRVGSQIFASCVVVHVDKNQVVSPIFSRVDGSPMDFSLAHLPSVEVNALVKSLAGVVPRPAGAQRRQSKRLNPEVGFPETSSPMAQWSTHSREVELTFGDGPLGITFESTHLRLLAVNNFEPGKQLGGSAVVKALPRLDNGLAGPAERSGLIAAGSFLVGINGDSTLDLTFEETVDRLRREKRPVRLRFLNSPLPFDNAREFAERLQALSLLSPLQVERENQLLPWVDTVRGAFAVLFSTLFCQYRDYIRVEHSGTSSASSPASSTSSRASADYSERPLPSPDMYGRQQRRRSSILAFAVNFDRSAFCAAAPPHARAFLAEFTQTQSFADFVNDGVLGRVLSSPLRTWASLELFRQCVHLALEADDPPAAITLLFEREPTPIASSVVRVSAASE